MATLWMPYHEEALDLSKKKSEENDYPAYCVYPPPDFAPITQTSPVSGGSLSSAGSLTNSDQLQSPELPTSIYNQSVSPDFERVLRRPQKIDYLNEDPVFQDFKRNALSAIERNNGGTLLVENPRMKRAVLPNNNARDEAYRQRRERNNEASRLSRNKRKMREIDMGLKVSYLQQEVANLKKLLSTKTCRSCHQPCRDS